MKNFRIPSLQIICWAVAALALINVANEGTVSAAIIASSFALCAVILRGITVYQEAEAYKLAAKIEDEMKR